MKSKPKGAKYRNLTARGGVIYYQRRANGKRFRFSCSTNDWDEAAAVARLYEERKGIGRLAFAAVEVPTFRDFAKRYVEEDTSHLAPTTRKDRGSYLREDGPLLGFFGAQRLDAIGVPELRAWWNQEVVAATRRTTRTGRAYLDVLSAVLGYACDLELLERNPVPAFRETLRRRAGTKRARQESQGGRAVRPIKRPEELAALVKSALEEDSISYVLVLLCLDAGLRLGEALGLRWGAIRFGGDAADMNRCLLIDQAKPRGGELAPPKSGRARTVALSRRLRDTLAEFYRTRFEPSPDALVFEGVDPANFRHREWRRILKRAGIGHRALKDLRDTYASQLLCNWGTSRLSSATPTSQ
jgi:integrase